MRHRLKQNQRSEMKLMGSYRAEPISERAAKGGVGGCRACCEEHNGQHEKDQSSCSLPLPLPLPLHCQRRAGTKYGACVGNGAVPGESS